MQESGGRGYKGERNEGKGKQRDECHSGTCGGSDENDPRGSYV